MGCSIMLLWYQCRSRVVPDQHQGNPRAVNGVQDSRNWRLIGCIHKKQYRLTRRWETRTGEKEKG